MPADDPAVRRPGSTPRRLTRRRKRPERSIDHTTVAIDLGTTNAKVGVFAGARLVATASRPIETTHPAPGQAAQGPGSWLEAVAAAVREAVAAADAAPGSVDAIALTAQSDSLVLADERGDPLGPCLLWMDDRGTAQAAVFERDLGRAEIHRRTGLRSAANYTGAKAAWVRAEDPDRFRAARWLLQPKDFLHLPR